MFGNTRLEIAGERCPILFTDSSVFLSCTPFRGKLHLDSGNSCITLSRELQETTFSCYLI